MLTINRSENQEVNLRPSQIVLHAILIPNLQTIIVERGEQNPPPKNAHEAKVEMDNWFALSSNCLARIIGFYERTGGVDREFLLKKALNVINNHLETGKITYEKRIVSLQPKKIVLHMVMEPETGEFNMFRPKNEPVPTTTEEQKEEIDNQFTLLCYVVARIISVCRDHGIPPEMMIEATTRVINIYLEDGGSGGHRKKIILELKKPEEPQLGS